jgi:hypothetical protein
MKEKQVYEDTINHRHDGSDRNRVVAHSPCSHPDGRPDDENATADMEEVMTLCYPVAASAQMWECRIASQGLLMGGLSLWGFTAYTDASR